MLDLLTQITLNVTFASGPLRIIVHLIGVIASFVMIFWVPVRIVWIIISSFAYSKIKDKMIFFFSIIVLILSIYPIVEVFLKAGDGTSWTSLPFVSPIPFFIYLFSEFLRLKAYDRPLSLSQVREEDHNGVVKNIRKKSVIYIYFHLKGRLSLKEYWLYWNIPLFVIFILFYGLEHGVKFQSTSITIISLLILVPIIATDVKRLHDLNKSGWWFLIHFIPFIGTAILSIFLWFVPGTKGVNEYD